MAKAIGVLVLLIVLAAAAEEFEPFYSAFTAPSFESLDGWVVKNEFKGNKFSKCGSTSLVGGFMAFGKRATIFKNLKLPPHYKLKINVQLWKIDSWDNEYMQVYVDGFLWQARWHHSEGAQLCGQGANQWNEAKYDVEFVVPHTSPNANVIMTSTLNEDAANESWGFRDFKLSILRCPEKCGVCQSGDANTCFYWDQHAFSWLGEEVNIEGWTLENGKAEQNNCAGINILGGYGKVGKGSNLFRVFENLPPHFAVLVKMQFWKIDSWDNEFFKVTVDNNLVFNQKFAFNEGVELCGTDVGANQGGAWAEKIVNIELNVVHRAPAIKVHMTSTLNEAWENESWGIRDFQLFIGACHANCRSCTGPAASDCTSCQSSFVLDNGKCKEGGQWYVLDKFFFEEDEFRLLRDWKIENSVGGPANPFTKCGAYNLVGGFGKFGAKATASRQFNIPPHRKLRIMLNFMKIDSWDNEWFKLLVDGKVVYQKQIGFSVPSQQICGQGHANWGELYLPVDVTLDHSADTADVVLTSTLDQHPDDESWGFREFMILYEPKEDCVYFYSECNFKGEQLEICRDQSSFNNWNFPVKSIKIPVGVTVEGFEDEQFKGKKVIYEQSQQCIDNFNFSFIQQKQTTKWVEVPLTANLRRVRIE